MKVQVKGLPDSAIQSALCPGLKAYRKSKERGPWKIKAVFPDLNLTRHLCEEDLV